MSDPMPDERLAQMSIAALSPFPFDHPVTRIVADAFAELVAEAKRARWEEQKLRARLASLGEPELQHRLINADGDAYTPTDWDLAMSDGWLPSIRHEVRDVYPTPWRPAPHVGPAEERADA